MDSCKGSVTGSCEYGNEHLGSITCEKFFDHPSEYQLLKEHSCYIESVIWHERFINYSWVI